jgi:hypothetical protein
MLAYTIQASTSHSGVLSQAGLLSELCPSSTIVSGEEVRHVELGLEISYGRQSLFVA